MRSILCILSSGYPKLGELLVVLLLDSTTTISLVCYCVLSNVRRQPIAAYDLLNARFPSPRACSPKLPPIKAHYFSAPARLPLYSAHCASISRTLSFSSRLFLFISARPCCSSSTLSASFCASSLRREARVARIRR